VSNVVLVDCDVLSFVWFVGRWQLDDGWDRLKTCALGGFRAVGDVAFCKEDGMSSEGGRPETNAVLESHVDFVKLRLYHFAELAIESSIRSSTEVNDERIISGVSRHVHQRLAGE